MWTMAAVLVAVVGSAIVAWQAWETHRTTSLSQKALDASAALAIDSARSRLDQDAPRIDVYVEGVSILTTGLVDMPGSQIEPGARWNLSQDAGRSLQVQARVRVKNLMSDRTTHLTVTGLHDPAMHADTEVLLLPTTERFYFLTATFTLSQWAENWESRQAGNPPPNVVEGCVISGDDRDEGVVDRWPMCLAAWPIQPAGDSDGTWQLAAGNRGQGLVRYRNAPAPRAQLLDLPAKRRPPAGSSRTTGPDGALSPGSSARPGCLTARRPRAGLSVGRQR